MNKETHDQGICVLHKSSVTRWTHDMYLVSKINQCANLDIAQPLKSLPKIPLPGLPSSSSSHHLSSPASATTLTPSAIYLSSLSSYLWRPEPSSSSRVFDAVIQMKALPSPPPPLNLKHPSTPSSPTSRQCIDPSRSLPFTPCSSPVVRFWLLRVIVIAFLSNIICDLPTLLAHSVTDPDHTVQNYAVAVLPTVIPTLEGHDSLVAHLLRSLTKVCSYVLIYIHVAFFPPPI